jgi:ABC-type multidrug transport system ATPase subunit
MKQKLSIITAIMHEPANLLLDEPVWGLDPLTSRALRDFIMERKGTTILATHSPRFVEEVANVVYILMQGRIVTFGDVNMLITRYGSIEETYFHARDRMGPYVGDVQRVTDRDE